MNTDAPMGATETVVRVKLLAVPGDSGLEVRAFTQRLRIWRDGSGAVTEFAKEYLSSRGDWVLIPEGYAPDNSFLLDVLIRQEGWENSSCFNEQSVDITVWR